MRKLLLLLLLLPVLSWAECPTTPGSPGWSYNVDGSPMPLAKQEYNSNLHCEIHRCQREIEELHKEFPERKGNAYYEKMDVISPACVCKNLGGLMPGQGSDHFGCNDSKTIFKHNNGTSGTVQRTRDLKGWGKHVEPKPKSNPVTTQPKVSIDDAKKQCTDIGFKAGTEKFGDCVLELMQ